MEETKIAFRISSEQMSELNEIKRVSFYDTSYAKLFRYIVDLGVDAHKKLMQKEGDK